MMEMTKKKFKTGLMNRRIWIILISLMACGNNNPGPGVPLISVLPKNVTEGDQADITLTIPLQLSANTSKPVKVSLSTADLTAHAGQDYIALMDSQIVFNAGETVKNISLEIISDTIMEFTEKFELILAHPENARLKDSIITITISDNDTHQVIPAKDGYISPGTYPGFTLAWSDEFSDSQLSTADWNYELGAGGWGNNELENYTNNSDNVFTDSGKLVIKAIHAEAGYTSGRLTTQHKQAFKYGLIDIRAKLPMGQGLWPALWMLGANIDQVGWPVCGELDIMELIGKEPGTVYGTAHWNSNGHQGKGGNTILPGQEIFADQYHVFSLLWEEDHIAWYLDYQKYFEISRTDVGTDWPFNASFFFIFNVAVGGNWPGIPDGTTVFPQSMNVDYVRVFRPSE